MKVLVAEDDANILAGLVEILEDEGYQTLAAADGVEALALYEQHQPDFICLDIMMPGHSGYDVCREIRRSDPTTPIVFISAKSEEIDKVVGLELGADDFIIKPFGVREVVARIRAVSRRALTHERHSSAEFEQFLLGDLTVFPKQLRAQRQGQTVELSLRDVNILKVLHQNAGNVVDRNTLFQKCWGVEHMPNSRTLDQHISQLRKRVELDPKNPEIIRTVHGAGYRWEP